MARVEGNLLSLHLTRDHVFSLQRTNLPQGSVIPVGETPVHRQKDAGRTDSCRKGRSFLQGGQGQWVKLSLPRPPSLGLADGERDDRPKQPHRASLCGWPSGALETASGDRQGRKVLGTWGCLDSSRTGTHFLEPKHCSKHFHGLGPRDTADLHSLLTNGKYINT